MSDLTYIPYGRQSIDEDDIAAVVAVLKSDWLTTGPNVAEFEAAFQAYTSAVHAVAVNSGTAALHCAMYAAGVQSGDEVIVPTMTFAASANSVLYQGATPIFVDVLPENLLIDPEQVRAAITPKTKAVVAVDYAGHACDYVALRDICDKHNLVLISDACHAVGGAYNGQPIGSIADMSTFSFHPVKHMTTGEGGMITTDNATYAQRMRTFRNHGITTDHRQRAKTGSWFYEMVDLGYNYRITDFQCALGQSQLKKLDHWVSLRQTVAAQYDAFFADFPALQPLGLSADVKHAYHLYVVRAEDKASRDLYYAELRKQNVGVNLHYIPVHLHPFYKSRPETRPHQYPHAEAAYDQILSLPIFPGMVDQQLIDQVLDRIRSVVTAA